MNRKFSILLVLLMFSCKSFKTEYVIGLKENIHHDDFEYSVSNFMVTRFLKNGSDTLYAKGIFYLVNFKVENRARRVNHEWDNSIAYIIDEKERSYENLNDVQKYFQISHPFGYKEKYSTPAGYTDSTYLAFDIPFDVTKPFLKVRGDFLMGDIFDGALFRRVRITLF